MMKFLKPKGAVHRKALFRDESSPPKQLISQYYSKSGKRRSAPEDPQKKYKKIKSSKDFMHRWLHNQTIRHRPPQKHNQMTQLPKYLVNQIMHFLSLSDSAKMGMACRYWLKCFDATWLSYDFFGKFDFQSKNSREIKQVF